MKALVLMKNLFLTIATVLFANTTHAADVACGVSERQVTKCHLSAHIDSPKAPRSAVTDFSLCSDEQNTLFLNLDTEIHPSIPGTRFELEANTYDPIYLWQDAKTTKVIRILYPTDGSRGFPLFMRLGAFNLGTDHLESITSEAVYQCSK